MLINAAGFFIWLNVCVVLCARFVPQTAVGPFLHMCTKAEGCLWIRVDNKGLFLDDEVETEPESTSLLPLVTENAVCLS